MFTSTIKTSNGSSHWSGDTRKVGPPAVPGSSLPSAPPSAAARSPPRLLSLFLTFSQQSPSPLKSIRAVVGGGWRKRWSCLPLLEHWRLARFPRPHSSRRHSSAQGLVVRREVKSWFPMRRSPLLDITFDFMLVEENFAAEGTVAGRALVGARARLNERGRLLRRGSARWDHRTYGRLFRNGALGT